MKNKNYFISTALILISFIFITGCDKIDKSGAHSPEEMIYVPDTQTSYNVNDKKELFTLVKILAHEPKEIKIIQATIADFKDSQGPFKAISAKYRIGDELTNLVVPLSKNQNIKSGNAALYKTEECEMKCTSAWGCGECTQTIIERCKSQKCSCTSGDGGCSSKITFPQ